MKTEDTCRLNAVALRFARETPLSFNRAAHGIIRLYGCGATIEELETLDSETLYSELWACDEFGCHYKWRGTKKGEAHV